MGAPVLPLLRFIGQRCTRVNLEKPSLLHVRKKAVVKRAARRWSTPRRPDLDEILIGQPRDDLSCQ